MPDLTAHLDGFLGKRIDAICPNRFHDNAANHCAHFVGHALGLGRSYNCVDFQGGTRPGANIRVHETFGHCSKVGRWADADLGRSQLVFVTRQDVVNVAAKTMQNIPQKHIGVFHGGMVYHYSNTDDRVIKQTPADFLARFQAAYTGTQALFFGYPDANNLLLNVNPDPPAAPAPGVKTFKLAGPDQRRWSARLVGEEQPFFVGREILDSAKGFYGLFFPQGTYYGPVYRGDDYVDDIDHWAYLLEATGYCESKNRFNLTNTYDRAKFTFGFYQLAAHTPRDNLILLFRELAADPDMAGYFPELKMLNGRLHRVDAVGGATDLEREFQVGSEVQLSNFMDYLNPRRKEIDRQEILHSARLIHWANTGPRMRAAQVRIGAEILQRKMTERYHPWFNLHGKSDIICLAVADVLHQGRGGKTTVRKALAQPKPLEALLKIADTAYHQRNVDLRQAIDTLKAAGKIGHKVYDAATNEFR